MSNISKKILVVDDDKDDLKLMTSEVWRGKASAAVAQAVNSFFAPRLAGSTGGRAGE